MEADNRQFDGKLFLKDVNRKLNDRLAEIQKDLNQGLKEIENIAIEKGCHLIHLDTFDFQAKDFYIKHGYEVFGVLDECPKKHKRYYLKKLIK